MSSSAIRPEIDAVGTQAVGLSGPSGEASGGLGRVLEGLEMGLEGWNADNGEKPTLTVVWVPWRC